MYNLVEAIGVKIGVNQRWQVINLANYDVADLYNYFRKCYITLTYGTPAVTVYLDMDKVKSRFSRYQDSLVNLLTANGDNSLPVLTSLPKINTRTAKFRDAYISGYAVKPWNALYGENSAPETRNDVLMTRSHPIVDYTDFYNHCLVTVNGLYHMSDTNGNDGIIVKDAMKSLHISNQNQLGILSFKMMGGIELVPITPAMVYKQDDNELFSSSAYVKLNKDLTGKTVLLVLGGYLHVNDNTTFNKVGLDQFKIDFSNYPMLDRYYESSNYIDLTSLGLSGTTKNKSQISISELMSDSSLLAYLTLSQSYFVILDAPEVIVNKQYIKRSNLSGMYTSYIEPKCPLVTGLGRHPEYVSIQESGQYAITVQDNTVQNRIYNTVNPYKQNSVGNSNLPNLPDSASAAHFLEILRDI